MFTAQELGKGWGGGRGGVGVEKRAFSHAHTVRSSMS